MESISVHKFLCDNIPDLDKLDEFTQESDAALRRIADKEIVFTMRFWAIYRVFKDNLDWRTTGIKTEFQSMVSAFIDVQKEKQDYVELSNKIDKYLKEFKDKEGKSKDPSAGFGGNMIPFLPNKKY